MGVCVSGAAGDHRPGRRYALSDAPWYFYLPFVLLLAASFALLVLPRWRNCIIALAVQYLGGFGLLLMVWPVGLAAVKLVAGWMACALLAASTPPRRYQETTFGGRAGLIFRGLAAALVWMVVFSLAPEVQTSLPLPSVILLSSLTLIGTGLLQLGMTSSPLRVILGLLTVLFGFEILYAALESSILVTGLLAMVTLGLTLAGIYLMSGSENEGQV